MTVAPLHGVKRFRRHGVLTPSNANLYSQEAVGSFSARARLGVATTTKDASADSVKSLRAYWRGAGCGWNASAAK